MPAAFPFRLMTPERTLMDEDAEVVTLRTDGGDIAFLAGHVPFIGAVDTGVLKVVLPGEAERSAAVHRGLIEVKGDGVFLVAGVAELAGEIDADRAERAHREAESKLAADADDAEAAAALQRAAARLELAGRPVGERAS